MNTSGWRELNTYGVFANPIYVPIITVIGAASVTITVGDAYTDLGATVDDGYGNADNENIVTTSTVNADNIGVYEVTYYYINGVGESDTKTRTVTVQAAEVVEPVQAREIIGISSLATIINGAGILNG